MEKKFGRMGGSFVRTNGRSVRSLFERAPRPAFFLVFGLIGVDSPSERRYLTATPPTVSSPADGSHARAILGVLKNRFVRSKGKERAVLRMQGFPAGYRRDLARALADIRRRLARPPGPIPRDLLDDLRMILRGPRPMVDLVYGGATGGCQTSYGRSAGYRILFCKRAFQEKRVAAVLFHEMVHIGMGWELDAEALENAWFTRGEGARLPTREDWRTFKQQEYQGWWVRMDPRTRRVTDYADRLILTFPPRPRR